MSGFTFRPAKREDTPLIIGIAGPTKSGKTYSALRLAVGLANGGVIAMLNTEGKRGEQYADNFTYMNCNMEKPFSPERYAEGIEAFKALKPAVCIIDSGTHLHDGPGGLLEYHERELDRIAGKGADYKRREKCTWSAWIKPKAAENAMVYSMLELECPTIICFRAKEKLLLVSGKDPVNLGWQPIVSDRVAYETIFTLVLPPHSRGVPDLDLSEMRDPFDKIVPNGKPIDEELGRKLAEWAKGRAQDGRSATISTPGVPVVDCGIEEACKPKCETCNRVMVFVPAGVTDTGKAFEAFWKCPAADHKYSLKHTQALAEVARLKAEGL